jgi:hypothetical protein
MTTLKVGDRVRRSCTSCAYQSCYSTACDPTPLVFTVVRLDLSDTDQHWASWLTQREADDCLTMEPWCPLGQLHRVGPTVVVVGNELRLIEEEEERDETH